MWVGCGYFVGNKCLCHNGQYMDYFWMVYEQTDSLFWLEV